MIIDLTESDDGIELGLQPVTRPNDTSRKPSLLPEDIHFSHHGLILPGTFSADNTISELDGTINFEYEPIPHKFEKARPSGSGVIRSLRADPLRNQRHILSNGNGPSGKSTGQLIPKAVPTSREVGLQNRAKRRKTDATESSRPFVDYPPIIPPGSRSVSAKSNTYHVVTIEKVEARKDEVTERQKAEHRPLIVAERSGIDEKRLFDIAKKRVVRHILSAMENHRNTLSSGIRKTIAEQVRVRFQGEQTHVDFELRLLLN